MTAEIVRLESEKFYLDPSTNEKRRFPTLNDPGTLSLTVVIPAKDEEERLPLMLDESLEYLTQRSKKTPSFTWEVIIVDDGSTDNTSKLGLEYSAKYSVEKVRVLTLAHNRGKGGAVRLGALSARGKTILMADADGATKFPDYEKLEDAVRTSESDCAVAVGSRAHLEKDSISEMLPKFYSGIFTWRNGPLMWNCCSWQKNSDTPSQNAPFDGRKLKLSLFAHYEISN